MEDENIKEFFQDQQISKVLINKLNEQRKTGSNCDYALKTEDGGSFTVHRWVLQSVCQFFETMFNSKFNDKEKNSVVLKRCTSGVLEKIVEFMYTGEIEITANIAKETLDAALFLGLNTLVDACTRILIKTVKCENCFDLLTYSETYFNLGGEALAKKCIEMISENIKTLRDSSQFVEMSIESLKMLCSCDRSVCNDEQIYLTIAKWVKFDMENREQHLSVLLDQIQFEEITLKFGIEKILNDKLLWENRDYISKIMDIMSKNWTQQMNQNQSQKIIKRFEQIDIYAIIYDKMVLYNNDTKSFSNIVTQFYSSRNRFAYSTFGKKNLFVCGGIINDVKSNDCVYYSLQENRWKPLPSMEIPRYCHQAITLDNKIYVCGGDKEKTVEIFDVNESTWTRGPSFDRYMPRIGLCLYNGNIYGVQDKSLQFLNTRTDKWIELPSLSQTTDIMCSAINYKDYIYGFGYKGVFTFDIRGNKWLENVVMYEREFSSNYPRLCMLNNEIYVCARISKNEEYMLKLYQASDISKNNSHIIEKSGLEGFCWALFSL